MDQKHIREIVLGPRQIYLFDGEKEILDEQNRFMGCLLRHFELFGQLELADFVKAAADTLGWPEFNVLQHIFWLTHELKIHFKSNEKTITPSEAKKILIDSLHPNLRLVLNKPVDAAVFSRVKELFSTISEKSVDGDHWDQAEFARCLVHQIRLWKNKLEKCMLFAKRPGFPGTCDIENASNIIKLISGKLDSYSLIRAFFDHADKVSLLVRTLDTLTGFYDRHAEQWQILVQFAQESEKTLSEDVEDPEVAAAYQRLNRLISSKKPYHKIDEALELYGRLQPHHLQVLAKHTRQRRMTALKAVEGLVRKMKSHLERHAASADLHNQSLYPLQRERKLIQTADSIVAINRSCQAAEEVFEDSWEKVAEQGPSA